MDLAVALPRDFPTFKTEPDGSGSIVFRVARALSPEEEETLRREYQAIVSDIRPIHITVDESVSAENDPFRIPGLQGDIDLIPSTRLARNTPRALRSLWEEDEDIWGERRRDVFEARLESAEQVLPEHWRTGRSRCLVHASVFEPHNLRNYLSIYDEVVLVFPIADSTEKIFSALRATPNELAELAALGRMRFVLPQSLDRYDPRVLAPIVEAERDSLVLSRRLSLATVLECRRRMPFLYPPVDRGTRGAMLRALREVGLKLGLPRPVHSALLKELGRSWAFAEDMLSYRGAMATEILGMGSIAASALREATGNDFTIELWNAGGTVEWGTAVGAQVFPVVSATYSEERHTELLAALYSGIRYAVPERVEIDVHSVIDDVLSVDGDVPLIEFARTFGGGDVERFRKLVIEIARHNPDPETRASVIAAFNEAVRQVDRRESRLNKLEVGGLLPALAAPALAVKFPFLALTGVLLKILINYRSTELAGRDEGLGRVLDRLNADLLAERGPDAVMVARMKRQLKRIGD